SAIASPIPVLAPVTMATSATRAFYRDARALTVQPVRHQHGVDVLTRTAVVALPVALALEAERRVQLERGLVPREDVQLELADAAAPPPLRGRLEQRAADASPPPLFRDHQAEVGDVRARRMRVARDRESRDDLAAVGLRDEDRGVRIAAQELEVPPLVAAAAPLAARRDQPAFGLAAHVVRERRQRGRVTRLGAADLPAVHATTKPAPPRRGSPAAASEPSARTSTAETPPKKRFVPCQRTSSWPVCSSASITSGAVPPSQWRTRPSRWTRGSSIASATPRPCATTFTITCMIAPRSRALPALPTTSRGAPFRRTTLGAIIDVSRAPGRVVPPARSVSPSMLFSCIPVPGTI